MIRFQSRSLPHPVIPLLETPSDGAAAGVFGGLMNLLGVGPTPETAGGGVALLDTTTPDALLPPSISRPSEATADEDSVAGALSVLPAYPGAVEIPTHPPDQAPPVAATGQGPDSATGASQRPSLPDWMTGSTGLQAPDAALRAGRPVARLTLALPGPAEIAGGKALAPDARTGDTAPARGLRVTPRNAAASPALTSGRPVPSPAADLPIAPRATIDPHALRTVLAAPAARTTAALTDSPLPRQAADRPGEQPHVSMLENAPIWSLSPAVTRPVREAQGPTPAEPSPGRLIAQITEPIRLVAGVRASEQTITVHLNPPELGRLEIDVASRDRDSRHVDVLIRVERPETQRLLDAHLPQIRDALEGRGVSLQNLNLGSAPHREPHGQEPPPTQERTPAAREPETSGAHRAIRHERRSAAGLHRLDLLV